MYSQSHLTGHLLGPLGGSAPASGPAPTGRSAPLLRPEGALLPLELVALVPAAALPVLHTPLCPEPARDKLLILLLTQGHIVH